MTLLIATWIFHVLSIVVCPALILYGLRALQRSHRKGLRYIQVRKPSVVQKICWFTIFHITFERPYNLLYTFDYLPDNLVFRIIYEILPSLPLICFFGTLRVWLLYYTTARDGGKTKKSLSNNIRGSTNDSSAKTINSVKKSILSRKPIFRFGGSKSLDIMDSETFMGRILIIPTLLYMIIHLGFMLTVDSDKIGSHTVLISAISLALPVVLGFTLLYQIPKRLDPFLQILELYICGILLCGAIIVQFIFSQAISDKKTMFLLTSILVIIVLTTICLIQTFGVVKYVSHSFIVDSDGRISAKSSDELFNYLMQKESFYDFKEYLLSEHSESFLRCFVEIIKFRKALIDSSTQSKHRNSFDKLDFPWVPDPDDFQEFFYKMYASHLFQKYCCESSPTQVNLPSTMLNKLKLDIEHLKNSELFFLFDEAQNEVWQLMEDSFRRYKNTSDYLHVLEMQRNI